MSGFADLSRDARLDCSSDSISFADDDGHFIASTSAIGGHVFPHDDLPRDHQTWLGEIAKRAPGMVTLYEVDGRRYDVFRHCRDHQRIGHPQPSVLSAAAR